MEISGLEEELEEDSESESCSDGLLASGTLMRARFGVEGSGFAIKHQSVSSSNVSRGGRGSDPSPQ